MATKWTKTGENTYEATVNGKRCRVERWVARHSRCRESQFGIGSYRDYYSNTHANPAVFDEAADRWVFLKFSAGGRAVKEAQATAERYALTGEGEVNEFWTNTQEKWRREQKTEEAK